MSRKTFSTALVALILASVQAASAAGDAVKVPASVQTHIDAATSAAGEDFKAVRGQCDSALPPALRPASPAGSGPRPGTRTAVPEIGAVQVFDNLYFVGTAGVSSWAVKTADGIILIDALNN